MPTVVKYSLIYGYPNQFERETMLTLVESMNYQPLIRPNHLHGRWAGRGAPPTSLPNPRWGERVDAAEAARLRQRWHDCGGGGKSAAEAGRRR